jgi:hypothetical protein
MFKTPWAREKERQEAADAAKEKAKAEHERMELEKVRALAATREAELELARLAARSAEERSAKEQKRLETERQIALAESARAKIESGKQAERRMHNAKLERCDALAKRAETELALALQEHARYEAKVAEYRNVPMTEIVIGSSNRFARAFAALYVEPIIPQPIKDEIEKYRLVCSEIASVATNHSFEEHYTVSKLIDIAGQVQGSVQRIRNSERDIGDLISYATNKLNKTAGGRMTEDKIRKLLESFQQ